MTKADVQPWDGTIILDKDVSFAFLPEDVVGIGPTQDESIQRLYIKEDTPTRTPMKGE